MMFMLVSFNIIMEKNGAYAHIWAYVFWPSRSHFWVNWAKRLYGNSGDHYLSIGDEKSKLQGLFLIFDFFGPNHTCHTLIRTCPNFYMVQMNCFARCGSYLATNWF